MGTAARTHSVLLTPLLLQGHSPQDYQEGSATGVTETCSGRVGRGSFPDTLTPSGWAADSVVGSQRRNQLHHGTHERRTKKRRCRQQETKEKIRLSTVTIPASAVLVKQRIRKLTCSFSFA